MRDMYFGSKQGLYLHYAESTAGYRKFLRQPCKMQRMRDTWEKISWAFRALIDSITVVSGGGAYVCGENSAMLNSIEGKTGRPRIKPPHLAEVGLYGKPTLVNNVETLCCVPIILDEGSQKFLSYGTAEKRRHPKLGIHKRSCKKTEACSRWDLAFPCAS